ncbi:MAG: FtsX-like permease family protein, partial [Micromonosporaceae bacterium]
VPGVRGVLPAAVSSVTLGDTGSTTVLAIDSARAYALLQPRDDLTDRAAGPLFAGLAAGARQEAAGLFTPLPAGATRLTGTLTVTTTKHPGTVSTVGSGVDLADRYGMVRRLPLPQAKPDGTPVRFSVELGPHTTGLYGFRISANAGQRTDTTLTWTVSELTAVTGASATTPFDPGSGWKSGHDLLAESSYVNAVVELGAARVSAAPGRVSVSRRLSVPTEGWGVYPAFEYGVVKATQPRGDALPVLVTPELLRAIGGTVGGEFTLPVSGGETAATVAGVIDSVPGVPNQRAVVADLRTLSSRVYAASGETVRPTEWRLATDPRRHAEAAREVAAIPHTETTDRYAVVPDPLGSGARLVLLPAALAVALLAGLGIAVDVRATARRRSGELAVLHTIGSTPRQLARSLVAEQAILAGLGVLTGLGIGIVVAITMGPLLVLTPDAARPVPVPVLAFDPVWVAVPVVGLLLLAFGLAARVAAGIRRHLPVLIVGDGR